MKTERFLRLTKLRIQCTLGNSTRKIRKIRNMARGGDIASGRLEGTNLPEALEVLIETSQFVPGATLKELLSDGVVRKQVMKMPNLKMKEKGNKEIDDIVGYFRDEAPRTFAILVRCGYQPYLYRFWKPGFTDKELPIEDKKDLVPFLAKTRVEEDGDDEETDQSIALNFIARQRPFSPLAFPSELVDDFSLESISNNTCLPFLREVKQSDGTFSTVWEVMIHKDYLEDYLRAVGKKQEKDQEEKQAKIQGKKRVGLSAAQLLSLGKETLRLSTGKILVGGSEEGHYLLAHKKLKKTLSPDECQDILITNSEKDILKMMNTINHPHLIHTIAHYSQKEGDNEAYEHFLFPYATGGNLQRFWEDTAEPNRDNMNEYVTWFLKQILGLAEAINKLHDKICRHGDLKPENILCFSCGGSDGNAPHYDLVIADVGLAKIHNDITAARNKPTDTEAGTITYSPPEYEHAGQAPWSRLFDVWSLGCIFLEFLVWILHGNGTLERFQKSIAPRSDRPGTFWEISEIEGELSRVIVHRAVTKQIKDLLKVKGLHEQLKQVLQLVAKSMIVVAQPEDGAATAEEKTAQEGDSSTISNGEKKFPPTAYEPGDKGNVRIKSVDLVRNLQEILYPPATSEQPFTGDASERPTKRRQRQSPEGLASAAPMPKSHQNGLLGPQPKINVRP